MTVIHVKWYICGFSFELACVVINLTKGQRSFLVKHTASDDHCVLEEPGSKKKKKKQQRVVFDQVPHVSLLPFSIVSTHEKWLLSTGLFLKTPTVFDIIQSGTSLQKSRHTMQYCLHVEIHPNITNIQNSVEAGPSIYWKRLSCSVFD